MLIARNLATGVLDIPGGIEIRSPSQPIFWPDDTTGSTQQFDAEGQPIGDQFDADTKFKMGTRF
jgi:hypothetical protein